MAIDVNQAVPATDTERGRQAANRLERHPRLVVPRPVVRARLPGGRPGGAPRRGTPRGLRAGRSARRWTWTTSGSTTTAAKRSARSETPSIGRSAPPPGAEVTSMNWHVAPDGLRDILLELQRPYSPKEIVITENGAAYDDRVEADGRFVTRIGRTTWRGTSPPLPKRRAGVPLQRLFRLVVPGQLRVEPGLHRRFGLVRVDFDSQRRTPKDSARWYQRLISASR